MFSPPVLAAILCFIFIEVVYGGGKLEVKFVRYVNPGGAGDNGNCCDGFSVCFSSCDHEFTLCIDSVSGPDSVSSCKYGVKKSGEISEANTIDFSSKVGIQDNPMVFTFDSWPGAVKVKVDVWDLDDSSGHDFVDFLSRLFSGSPSPDVNRANWYEFQLKKRTTLSSQIRVYCDSHYYGEFCNKSCIPSDSNEIGQYYCDKEGNLVCKQHYFGSKCTRYCEPHNDSTGHYACDLDTGDLVCLDGWTGSNCLEDIDECAVDNSTTNSSGAANETKACSFHGYCSNLEGGYKCTCEEHYTGETCSEIKLYCSDTTCANNGTCVNSFGGFMCLCSDKWTGKYCEIELTPCTYHPCQNNGQCNIQGDGYNCTCDERYTGDHCEKEITITTTTTTERVQVASEDSIIVFLVGYLNDSDNDVLIEGLRSMVQEYGNFNGDITLEVVKHKVTLKDGRELTQLEITAICTTTNIDGLLARIFRERGIEELERYLPLQLYYGTVDPYTPPQYQETSWVSHYWFVILIIIVVALAIVGGMVVFFIIRKRRQDNFKNKLAGDSSVVEEISPDTAIGFDNSLYFNVNQPEKVSGLPGTAHGEQS